MFNAGQYAEMERRARSLLERYPDSGFVWKVLGVTLQAQGRDSLPALQKAAELLPGDAEAHYNLGNTLLMLGRLNEAEACFRRALQIRPDDADPHYNLGNTFLAMGRLNEAEASYRQVLQIKPFHAASHYNLGNILYERGCLAEAEASYRHALQARPNCADTHVNLGNVLRDAGRLDEAEDSFRQALQIRQDHAEAHNNMGEILLALGRLAEAEVSFRQALRIRQDYIKVRLNLVSVRKVEAGDDNLAALIAADDALRNGEISLSGEDAVCLHFALGKCYDDIGDYEKAFPHFLEGNKLKRTTLVYNPEHAARYFAEIMQNFDRGVLDRLGGDGDLSHLPIFILGMPRSGTTLTEQIIASHPSVYGAGEFADLGAIMRHEIHGAAFPANTCQLDQGRLAEWGRKYVAGLQRRAPEARRITDKMPANFLALGLIHLMLPNAKIIHVNRNPVDTCLSCFTTLFKQGQEHTYDLAELGSYYSGYARLMDHWREVLPDGAFLDVNYEDIVEDMEGQARRLTEYCGLEWDDACINFHKNKRAVSTASMAQVRQPVYRSSVERWRSYQKFLEPLLGTLGEVVTRR